MDAWWEDLYDEQTATLLLERPVHEIRAEVAFLRRLLELDRGGWVFDQCCGLGGHTLELARQGSAVIGVDQSGAYIQRARLAAEAEGLGCAFHHADAFEFVAERPCDAAFNWATGFGNAATDARNAAMLRRAFESLRPGGRFVLDFQNIARILREFRECMVRRVATPAGELLLLRESTLDLTGGCLRQVWTYLLPDGRRVARPTAVRLYLPHTLAEMLERCGFENVEFFGDLDGAPLSSTSPRCIARARRPR